MKILVFDDSEQHRRSAQAQLSSEHDVTIVSTYDEAESQLCNNQFDVFLTDLLVPASSRSQGSVGQKYVAQEMPLGTSLALLALQRGVQKIAIITDANHHDHPASASFDAIRSDTDGLIAIGDVKIVALNSYVTAYFDATGKELGGSVEGWPKDGVYVAKNWAAALKRLA
ncbi:MAG: response regulator [Patescibacteria group bacterium]